MKEKFKKIYFTNYFSDYIAFKPIYAMLKLFTCAALWLCVSTPSNAQFLSKVIPGGHTFSQSLSTVIEHFQNNYNEIKGELLPSDPDRDIFKSTVLLPGTLRCVIYRFHSKEDSSASYQATLYKGEDFNEAAKVYKKVFKQTSQTKFKVGGENYSLEGTLLQPSEDLRFTSSILRSTNYSDLYKNFIAEVEIINNMVGYTVHLYLHNRKADIDR
ncbi:MAG: hypothetical protein WD135_08720 [Ferruginibacter sp.]